MQKLIIDTDPGQDIDDLLALFFALRRPELDVRAITTVMQDAARRARLVKRLLRYLDRTDIPVAAGMELPLRSLSEAEFRARADLPCCLNHYAFAEPEDPRDVPGPLDAVDLIVRTVDANAGDIALACIGPLTNVACALRKCPGIAAKIQYIAMMGGELTLNRLEHNVASDYTAADIVVNSGIPIFMGTWDVTRRFVLSMDDVALFRRHRAPVCQALAAAVDLWHPAQSWKPGPVMYDLFPMIWAMDRSLYTTASMRVRVETQGEHTRGMTVSRDGGVTVQVTTGIQVEAVRELYLGTVLA